jgi:hypothetical protein
MPDARFYPLRFNHILYLYNNDVQAGITDPSYSSLDRYYVHRLGATVQETTTFLAEAQSWSAEVAPIDAQAHSIVAAIRALNPGGKLAPGAQPPAPPQTLADLQQQRDAITLKHVANLRAAFGDVRFTQLDDQARRVAHLTSRGSALAGAAGHSNPMSNPGGSQ